MMKIKGLILLLCFIIPIFLYGTAIAKTINMKAECIGYLEMAADANSVELAEKHLSKGIEYLEKNNLKYGSTGIFFHTPGNNIEFWYENLKSAQIQLQEFESESELEESNILMKLRETLLDETGEVTHPNMISFYPNHALWFWFLILGWLLLMMPVGGFLLELYDY